MSSTTDNLNNRLQALTNSFHNSEQEIKKKKNEVIIATQTLLNKQEELANYRKANVARKEKLDNLVPQVSATRLQIEELERSIKSNKDLQQAQYSELAKATQVVTETELELQKSMREHVVEIMSLVDAHLQKRAETRAILGLVQISPGSCSTDIDKHR